MAAPWPRQVVTGLSARRPEFDLGLVYDGSMATKMPLRQASSRLLQLFAVSFIPLIAHVHFKLNTIVTNKRRGRTLVTYRNANIFRKTGSGKQKVP
jgi:hypothetical protein